MRAAEGSAAILAAVSGILPETLRVHGLVFEIGVVPRRGFGKMPNPAAKMAALPIGWLTLHLAANYDLLGPP